MNHPLHKAQNLMTHPLFAPAHPSPPPLYFLTSPLRKQRNRQYQLYILAGTFFVSLISHIVACQQALL